MILRQGNISLYLAPTAHFIIYQYIVIVGFVQCLRRFVCAEEFRLFMGKTFANKK